MQDFTYSLPHQQLDVQRHNQQYSPIMVNSKRRRLVQGPMMLQANCGQDTKVSGTFLVATLTK